MIFDIAKHVQAYGPIADSNAKASAYICYMVADALFAAGGVVAGFKSNRSALGKALKESYGENWTKGPASRASQAAKVLMHHPDAAKIAHAWIKEDFSVYTLGRCYSELPKNTEELSEMEKLDKIADAIMKYADVLESAEYSDAFVLKALARANRRAAEEGLFQIVPL